jgi:tellurite resistance protein
MKEDRLPSHAYHFTAATLIQDAALARTTDLMEAMVAAYTLMAHADGEVAPAERRRIFSILRDNPAMSVFSRAEIAAEIAEHEANYRLDPEVGEQIAREKLAPVAAMPRESRLVVAACRDLIPADGVAHPSEYRMLEEIKALLGWTGAATPQRSLAAPLAGSQ